MKEIVEMIDLHSHILYGLDDGPEAIEDSIQMCRISYQDGIKTIVATPHILPRIYENNRSTILSGVAELNNALKKFRISNNDPITQFLDDGARQGSQSASGSDSVIRNPQSAFKILPGADVHFSFDMFQLFENGEIMTVNDNGRYLMLEFDFEGIPYHAEEVLFRLVMRGITPIITHPERNREIARGPKKYYEMIKMGCLGQVTAMSLTGEFGPGAKRIAEKLLEKRLIHIIASDAHSVDGRPPILSAAVKAAEKIVGKKEAIRMVTEYPEAIIEGRKPDVPEPLSL